MEQVDIKCTLIEVVKIQKTKGRHIAVDVYLQNGNILLKSFRLYDYDKPTNVLKGMTMHEEYAYLREGREPIYAYFNVTEIKQLDISSANYLF